MRRRFQNNISTLWTRVSWAVIALVITVWLVSCKTVQSDSPRPLEEFKLSLMDQLLDSLNNPVLPVKTLNTRTGKPFTWWQRNISGAGKVKYKNIYIASNNKDNSGSNNKDKSNNSTNVKAKGSAVANTGDSTNIAAAPNKNVNKGKSVAVEGEGNKVTTKSGGTPLWVWLAGLGLVVFAAYRFIPSFRNLLPF